MASTVSAAYASYSGENPFTLTDVPSSADEYIALFYDLSGYTITSLSTSVSARGSCQFEDDISVQTQVQIYTADIDSTTGKAYVRDWIGNKLEDWWIPANSSSSQTTNVSVSLNRTFEENTGICLQIILALPDIVGGSASATISSMPRLSVEGTAGGGSDPGTGGGGSSTPSQPSQPPVSATPSSPSGSSTVTAGKDTNFSWRISKNIAGATYAGSELEYRYGSSSSIFTLGTTDYDITTFTKTGGFNANSIVQWRVRTAIEAYDIEGLLREAGYDLGDNGSGSGDDNVYTEDEWVIIPDESGTTGSGGLYSEGYSLAGNKLYSKWSDWVSFQTGDYEYEPEPTYSASVSIVTPSGGTKNGTEAIQFGFDITTEAYYATYEAQYSVDDGITWQSLASGTTGGSAEVRFSAGGFPAGTVRWRARAQANADWSNWATASFTVTYDGFGQIVVTYGPINKGTRGSSYFTVEAGLNIIGETGETVTLQEATFCWRSGESNNFAEIAMTPYPYTGALSDAQYQLQLAPYSLPYGIIQWYLKGKDSKDVETETEIYNTYILRSVIDSIALSPISTIENTENELTFTWAYIADDGRPPLKAEIQFSEDGVSWGYPISVEFDQNE